MRRASSSTTAVSPTTTCEESCAANRSSASSVASTQRTRDSTSEAGDSVLGEEPKPITISPITLRFPAARVELAFCEQLSDNILDGVPSEALWLVVGSALGYANFVADAFESGQTFAAVVPLAAVGLAAVMATPALCLQGLFDREPSRVLTLLASCASVLLLACPLATSLLCTESPCDDGEGWRLAAAAQDALLAVAVLSSLFAGLPMLLGCLPPLTAAAAQAVVVERLPWPRRGERRQLPRATWGGHPRSAR